ncbi:MAG: glycine dehydrogenase (aminomethyl-transferring), partial [Saprospiraceae bacterium]|nr:glycine dehydrogenase (aminomethyl-transferring) [Saprospiraceae bacterium]
MNTLHSKFLSQDRFVNRHLGPNEAEAAEMLRLTGYSNLDALIDATVPDNIRRHDQMDIPPALSEFEYLTELKNIAGKNKIYNNFIGRGYYGTITPSVISRNIFQNPGWYTQYTPYQAEIAQGRLEA